MQFPKRGGLAHAGADAGASVGSVGAVNTAGSVDLKAALKSLIGRPRSIRCRLLPSEDAIRKGSKRIGAVSALDRQETADGMADGSKDPRFLEQAQGFFKAEGVVKELSFDGSFPEAVGKEPKGTAMLAWLPSIVAVHERIGVGSFGEVFRCTVRHLEGEVAVKVLRKGSDIRQERELELVSQLHHERLVQFLGLLDHAPRVFAMELCHGGSLDELLHGPAGQQEGGLAGLSLQPRARAMVDVLSAVEFLHSRHIVHRDVKAGNVFLTGAVAAPVLDLPTVKLGDLGLAREVDAAMTQCAGTFRYMAPEVLVSERYAEPADVFSCGILLHEVMSGKKPFASISGLRVAAAIATGTRPEPADIGTGPIVEALGTVLHASWAEDPEVRPTSAYLRECLEPLVPGR